MQQFSALENTNLQHRDCATPGSFRHRSSDSLYRPAPARAQHLIHSQQVSSQPRFGLQAASGNHLDKLCRAGHGDLYGPYGRVAAGRRVSLLGRADSSSGQRDCLRSNWPCSVPCQALPVCLARGSGGFQGHRFRLPAVKSVTQSSAASAAATNEIPSVMITFPQVSAAVLEPAGFRKCSAKVYQ